MSYLKVLKPKTKTKVEEHVKLFLREARRYMRDIEKLDVSKIDFTVNNPYYCEAFGIMRGLALLGYGFLGSVNLDGTMDSSAYPRGTIKEHNLRWWLERLKDEVLEEEGFKRRSMERIVTNEYAAS